MWIVLFFFLAIGGIVWVFVREYRSKTSKWEAASKDRLDRILMEQAARPAPLAERPGPSPAASPAAPSAGSGERAAAPFRAAERFLGQAETLVYYLLRAGMPEYAIFAKVPLESILAAPGAGSVGGQPWQRMAQQRLDFVVCDRGMRVAAVIALLDPRAAGKGGQSRSNVESLRAAGVRVVELNPADLPRREGIRKLVLAS
jgi:hypothetical protein